MNLLEILRKAQLDLGRQFDLVGNEFIVQNVIDGYRDICIKNNWSFFLKEGGIKIIPYVTHTIADYNDTTKQFSLTPDPGVTFLNHKLYCPLEMKSFNITAITGAILTVDKNMAYNLLPTGKVYAYIQDYALPADCAYEKEIAILDPRENRHIVKVVQPTMSKGTKFDWYTFDEPQVYMAKSRDMRASTDNSNYIMFWPFLNATAKWLTVWYFRKPFGNFDTFLYTGGTTASHLLPEIPDEFSHLLKWVALEAAYLKLNDARLGYATHKKYEVMKDMLDVNNGSIAMEHILKETPHYGWDQWPDFNTINVRLTS